MKCIHLMAEFDDEIRGVSIISCGLGIFEDEKNFTAIQQFCSNCRDREISGCCKVTEDEY